MAGSHIVAALTSPADTATVTTSMPILNGTMSVSGSGHNHTARLHFQLATNSGFTTGVVDVYSPSPQTPWVPGVNVPNDVGPVAVSGQVSAGQFLGQTVYYYRARAEQDFAGTDVGSWTATRTFTVSHPPVGSVNTPAGDVTLPFVGTTTSSVLLNWSFSDPSPGDLQTEYDWDLDIVSGPTNLLNNVVASDLKLEIISIAAPRRMRSFRWRVRVKDRHGIQSAYSSFSTFYVSDPPTVTPTYPTDGGFVLEPNPTFLWSFGGTRPCTQYKFLLEILDPALADAVIFSSGEVFSATAAYSLPLPFSLDVGVPYKLRLTVTDSLGLTTVKTHSFETDYDAPDDPPFTLVTTNYSQFGFVRIAWSNVVEDATFRAYRVYRSDDSGLTYREIHATSAHSLTTPGITHIKEVGQTADSTGGTTTTVSVAAGGVPVGDHAVAYVSVDNAGTSGAAPGLTVTDARSNVWTVLSAVVNDPGAANEGIVAYLAWTKVTTALLASDVITFTWGVSVTAKAVSVQQFRGIRGANPVLVTAGSTGSSTGQSLSIQPTHVGQLVIAMVAIEGGTADSFTQDADTTGGSWTGITRRGSGTTTAGATIAGAFKVVTSAVQQSYDPVLGTSRDWASIVAVFDPAGTYTFDDYTAPSHDDVWYYVVQVAERFGQEFEGTKTPASVDILTDDYWLVSADQSVVVRLWNTNADDFGDEYEEEEIILIGRGRKYDVGSRIGTIGSLTAQLRTQGATTARAQRKDLEAIREAAQAIWLRNPFGDLILVHIGKVDFTRIAGVGHQEFLDCTIPYAEVS